MEVLAGSEVETRTAKMMMDMTAVGMAAEEVAAEVAAETEMAAEMAASETAA